jgi:hypothetical protein
MAKVLLLLLLLAACAQPDRERVLGAQANATPPEAVLGAQAVVVPQPPQPVLPTPSARSSGESTTPTGVAQAAVEGIAAQASGVGEIGVGRFADNPAGPIGFATAGFFTLSIAPGSAFGLVTVMRCQVGGGLVYWWDGAAWQLASQQAFDRDTGCVTVAVTGTTAPSLAQVAGPGAAFALGEPPMVAAVDPPAGPPGAAVAIAGERFVGATGVSFGRNAAPTFRVESDTRVVAEAPPGGGASEVIVTTPAGSSAIGSPTFAYR